jgi:hypothetical protein
MVSYVHILGSRDIKNHNLQVILDFEFWQPYSKGFSEWDSSRRWSVLQNCSKLHKHMLFGVIQTLVRQFVV